MRPTTIIAAAALLWGAAAAAAGYRLGRFLEAVDREDLPPGSLVRLVADEEER